MELDLVTFANICSRCHPLPVVSDVKCYHREAFSELWPKWDWTYQAIIIISLPEKDNKNRLVAFLKRTKCHDWHTGCTQFVSFLWKRRGSVQMEADSRLTINSEELIDEKNEEGGLRVTQASGRAATGLWWQRSHTSHFLSLLTLWGSLSRQCCSGCTYSVCVCLKASVTFITGKLIPFCSNTQVARKCFYISNL